jgi:phage shock protein A
LLERYVKQLADQESHLDALRKEVAALQAKHAQAQSELNAVMQQLSLDATL